MCVCTYRCRELSIVQWNGFYILDNHGIKEWEEKEGRNWAPNFASDANQKFDKPDLQQCDI